MRPCRSTMGGVLALLLALVVGCWGAPTGTVQGKVAFDGVPLTRGVIVFLPADGQGQACGGVVRDGAYVVTGIPPGAKVATIKAAPVVPEAESRSSESMYEKKASQPVEDMSHLPIRQAIGNNAEVTVVAGDQSMDFLLRPADR